MTRIPTQGRSAPEYPYDKTHIEMDQNRFHRS